MKNVNFAWICVLICLSADVFAADSGYTFKTFDRQTVVDKPASLPDLSRYTRKAIDEKIDKLTHPAVRQPIVIEVKHVFKEFAMFLFTDGGRAGRWAKLQGGVPRAIFIRSGVVTPADIAAAVNDPGIFQYSASEKIALARLPVVIENGAALIVQGETTKSFKMSQQRGAFLVVDGVLAMLDTQLVAWNETKQSPAWYEEKTQFRPFLTSLGGSELYMHNTHNLSLGYYHSKSYGLTVTQHPQIHNVIAKRPSPIAWILNSVFEDLYYGFYCYESDGLALIDNVYKNNIIYGIDPHDRSSHLIFARNTVYGTQKKHGIIGSRSVNDSWFIDNVSYHNKLSGFMLDRSSNNNVVVGNKFYENGSDGITLYESDNNFIANNQVSGNKFHGVHIRNSQNAQIIDNNITGNGAYGVFGQIKNLTEGDEAKENRDIVKDPYVQLYSFTLKGGQINANLTGVISAIGPEYIKVADIDVKHSFKKNGFGLEGPLQDFYTDFWDTLYKKQQGFELVRKDSVSVVSQ
ncbi:MAG TPA: NosD domain-containing protein [Cellvibrio sp.]|nr:NosD domain-containing protein [Cellvibrio sp.]